MFSLVNVNSPIYCYSNENEENSDHYNNSTY